MLQEELELPRRQNMLCSSREWKNYFLVYTSLLLLFSSVVGEKTDREKIFTCLFHAMVMTHGLLDFIIARRAGTDGQHLPLLEEIVWCKPSWEPTMSSF